MTTDLPAQPAMALIGAGTIGTAWAVVFAAAGMTVRLFDADAARLPAALDMARARLRDLAAFGLVDDAPEAAMARIAPTADLAAALVGADHVQESIPEDMEMKRDLLARIADIAAEGCTIASSTSFIEPSRLFDHVAGRARCLVLHPGNPPFLIRVVEVVPATFTAPETIARAEALMTRAAMAPIRVNKEVEGFVFNRLQGALLREAYCLVRDGVTTATDIDRIVRDGLGIRLAVTGPFENADLNAPGGIEGHARRMGPSYARLGAERGQNDPWTPDLVAKVATERRAALPMDQRAARAAWRDRAVMTLLRARRDVLD
ncbi:MAG: 3-hydroxyacyl-CoA dehydrogenase [Rhodospirillales bacterium CG15_BIG_FIL_POST_REV_8_21_14_020_66_15]|nr:MAG: 3-hydroxyacyl-CoA dehydrogenase [Rhodospirillales bacterium CG15_BIG_FIL_POST_REV_8_21_14_020_66_15]